MKQSTKEQQFIVGGDRGSMFMDVRNACSAKGKGWNYRVGEYQPALHPLSPTTRCFNQCNLGETYGWPIASFFSILGITTSQANEEPFTMYI